MSMMRPLGIWIVIVALLTPNGALGEVAVATTGEAKSHPGVISFDRKEVVGDILPTVESYLDKVLLQALTSMSGDAAPKLPAGMGILAKDAELLHILVFEDLPEENAAQIQENLAQCITRATNEGWSPVLHVNDGDNISLLMRADGTLILGMALLVRENTGLIFVNIAGNFDPQKLGGAIFGIMGNFFQGELAWNEIAVLFPTDKQGPAVVEVVEPPIPMVMPKRSVGVSWLGKALRHEPGADKTAAAIIPLDAEARAKMLEGLISVVNDDDIRSTDRHDATRLMSRLGRDAVPVLVTMWQDPKHFVRWEAGQSLGMMGAEAETAIPALVESLSDRNDSIRRRALRSLHQIASAGGQEFSQENRAVLVQAFLKVVNNRREKSSQRENAARALSALEADAIPALLSVYQDPRHPVRWEAVQAFGMMGPAACAALPDLINGFKDPSFSIQKRVMQSLEMIARNGGCQLAEAEREALQAQLLEWIHNEEEDSYVRENATRALSLFGTDSVPILLELWHDKEHRVRWEVVQSLGLMGWQARDAIPALIASLEEEPINMRNHIMNTLADMVRTQPAFASEEELFLWNKTRQHVLAALTTRMKREDYKMRRKMVELISGLGNDAAPYMIEIMSDH